MGFGERLYQLRKEKGLSQEGLADALDVSRQAVSRWENNQGWPETDKLMQMSNLFGVTVDYLLRDEPMPEGQSEQTERGYYASRETVQSYLRQEKKEIKITATAVVLFILCGLPSVLSNESEIVGGIGALVIVFAAVAMLVSLAFRRDSHKRLKNEPLCFDSAYLTELCAEHERLRRPLRWLVVGGIALLPLGLSVSILVDDLGVGDERLYSVTLIMIAVAVWCFIFAGGLSSTYEMLTENEAYIARRRGGGWLWYVTMGLAGCVFVVALLVWKSTNFFWDGYGGNMVSALVFIFPLTALLTWGYLRGRRKK